jgi:predicted CoA-binding protein
MHLSVRITRLFTRNMMTRSMTGVKSEGKSSGDPMTDFFNLKQFAVVGASNDRDKFGNKVLRCYQQHNRSAIPIHPKEKIVEGIPSLESLSKLAEEHPDWIGETGVSIITPPPVSKKVIEEGFSHGFRWFFFQPGACDSTVRESFRQLQRQDKSLTVIEDCVLVQLGCSH